MNWNLYLIKILGVMDSALRACVRACVCVCEREREREILYRQRETNE